MNISTKRIKLCLILLCLLSLQAYSQKKNSFTILFYNVENLFDTINDPHKNDNEFLPEGKKQWNTNKYYTKLNHIAQVIIAAGEWQAPDLVGFAEVENIQCTRAITNSTALSKIRYKTIHHESRDKRGIDVSCIYNPKTVSVIKDTAYPVIFDNNKHITTRDILHIELVMKKSKDSIHVFFCHFPSRYGGTQTSEFKRIYAAKVLLEKIDSIKRISPQSQIVIMGDFNDTPKDKSIKSITKDNSEYTNLSDTTNKESHYYRGVWRALDQCIISNNITNNYIVNYLPLSLNFIVTTDSKNNTKPLRTYQGPAYLRGYSDHLPIKLQLQRK